MSREDSEMHWPALVVEESTYKDGICIHRFIQNKQRLTRYYWHSRKDTGGTDWLVQDASGSTGRSAAMEQRRDGEAGLPGCGRRAEVSTRGEKRRVHHIRAHPPSAQAAPSLPTTRAINGRIGLGFHTISLRDAWGIQGKHLGMS